MPLLQSFGSIEVVTVHLSLNSCAADVVEYAERWANSGKVIVIAALDGTWQRQPFNSILQLIPLAEDVCKLKAVCSTCRQDAAFTKRLTKETEVEVGLEAALLSCQLGDSLHWTGVWCAKPTTTAVA